MSEGFSIAVVLRTVARSVAESMAHFAEASPNTELSGYALRRFIFMVTWRVRFRDKS